MLRLPDTGETISYTSTFGEDNDYTINPPFFLIHGDGTATDTVTGLMWQRTDGGEMTIENARIYVDTLTLGGYTNWRLPKANEAFSILNHQRTNPALDTNVFTRTAADYWWASESQANDASKIWETNAGGGIGSHPKSETISAGGIKRFHTRAVRDVNNPPSVSNHFTDNGNGTVTDHLTGLIWLKNQEPDSMTWEESLQRAGALNTGGLTDWRLPNIKELQSIVDVNIINPSVDTIFFAVAKGSKYWSSTTLPNQTLKSWYLDINPGLTTYELKTARLKALYVRGNSGINTEIKEAVEAQDALQVYPNPFSVSIHVKSKAGTERFEVTNGIGQMIYSGIDIESQNFSLLNSGLYFLKMAGVESTVVKIVKK